MTLQREGALRWLAQRTQQIVVGTLALTFGGGAIVLIRLEDSFYIEQIAVMGCGSLVGVIGGTVAIVRITRRLRQHMDGLDELMEAGQRLINRLTGKEVIPQADWLTLVSERYKPGRRSYALPAGVTDGGRLVEFRMSGPESHLLITGATGTGKSVYANQLVAAAAMSGRYQVVIIALSGKDFGVVRNMQNVHLFTGTGAANIDQPGQAMAAFAQNLPDMMVSFNREIVRRQRLAEDKGARDLSSVRADQRPPAVLFIIEEFTNALEQVKTGFTVMERKGGGMTEVAYAGRRAQLWLMGQVTMAVQFGRSSLMHLVLIGQRPTGVIPNSIKKQMVLNTFRVADEQEAYWATVVKNSGADKLRLADQRTGGQIFVKGAFTQEVLTVPWTPDDDLRQATTMYEPHVEYLGDPDWVHGYDPGQGATTETEFREEIPAVVEAVPTVPAMIIDEPDPEVASDLVTKTPGDGGVGTRLGTKPTMPASFMSFFVGKLLERNPNFQNRTPAYSDIRTFQIFMLHYENYYLPEDRRKSENEIMTDVFGNRNSRYRPYVKMCGQYTTGVLRAYEKREMAKCTN